MRRRPFPALPAVLAVALTVAGAGFIAAAPSAAGARSIAEPPAGPRSVASAAASAGGGARTHRVVTLVTGDRVDVTTDAKGRPRAAVVRPRPGSAPFQQFQVGPHLYVIPRSAAPKIGHSLALAQFDVTAPGTPVLTPKYPMHTLTVHGLDDAGHPSSDTDVDVVNVDDANRFFAGQGFVNGVAKFSVPAGHYAATSIFFSTDPATGKDSTRFVELAEFTISGDSAVTVDARKATSLLSVRTPRPATGQQQQLTVERSDQAGNSVSVGVVGMEQTYLSPTSRAVSVGELHFSIYWRLAAPDNSYTYDLEFGSDGAIAAKQSYVVGAGQLAAIDARYNSEVPRTGLDARFSFLPWETFNFRAFSDLPQPGQRTEYILADPDIVWSQDVVAVNNGNVFAGEQFDADRSFSPGQRLAVGWNKQPMHPGVQVDLGSNVGGLFDCPVCRIGDTLFLNVWPFADNTPGHFGAADEPVEGLTESVQLNLYQDGKPVEPDPETGLFPLAPAQATYRVVLDTVREAAYLTLSTKTHTEWTFTSAHADGSGRLPTGWVCDDGVEARTDCAVVPMMMARYDLPLGLSGGHAPGATAVDVFVDHIQGGPALPVSAGTVSVSYDDGVTWVPATVTDAGAGHLRVAYTTPATASTNGFVALKVTAADAAGGKLSQTLLRAYSLN